MLTGFVINSFGCPYYGYAIDKITLGNLIKLWDNGFMFCGYPLIHYRRHHNSDYSSISYIKDRKVISYDYSYWQPPEEQYIPTRLVLQILKITDNVLPVSENLKNSNNYSIEKKNSSSRFSFGAINLIGKLITYYDDKSIKAEVVADKEVKFEGKKWRLSPITREIETRKQRCTKSGAYWGIDKWVYQGKTLEELMKHLW